MAVLSRRTVLVAGAASGVIAALRLSFSLASGAARPALLIPREIRASNDQSSVSRAHARVRPKTARIQRESSALHPVTAASALDVWPFGFPGFQGLKLDAGSAPPYGLHGGRLRNGVAA